jgi:hypothetical protein
MINLKLPARLRETVERVMAGGEPDERVIEDDRFARSLLKAIGKLKENDPNLKILWATLDKVDPGRIAKVGFALYPRLQGQWTAWAAVHEVLEKVVNVGWFVEPFLDQWTAAKDPTFHSDLLADLPEAFIDRLASEPGIIEQMKADLAWVVDAAEPSVLARERARSAAEVLSRAV